MPQRYTPSHFILMNKNMFYLCLLYYCVSWEPADGSWEDLTTISQSTLRHNHQRKISEGKKSGNIYLQNPQFLQQINISAANTCELVLLRACFYKTLWVRPYESAFSFLLVGKWVIVSNFLWWNLIFSGFAVEKSLT